VRLAYSVSVEPDGQTHCVLFTTGVEVFGVRGETLPLISIVAEYRPKRFCPALMRPTTLDPLEKPPHCFLIRFQVHADRCCPIDESREWDRRRQVQNNASELGGLKKGATKGLDIL
jgi:hypothetical protein